MNRNMRQYSAMRVLIVSAAYPPDHCGVGDYARHLAWRLEARDKVPVAVLTAARAARQENTGPKIFHAAGAVVRTFDVWRAAHAFGADLVHLQVPTQRPLSRLLAFCTARLLRLPVVQTSHEPIEQVAWIDRLNLPALRGLIYVRDDLPSRMPIEARALLSGVRPRFIPNGRTIPAIALTEAERSAIRLELGAKGPLVAFFGFANANKGVHRLFEIADPACHHLLLICELDAGNEYQRRIRELASGGRWQGRATVTGFTPPEQVARWLSAADAVVFPFPEGVGSWNTSVNAAMASGSLVVATSGDASQLGYDARRNLFFAPAADTAALRAGLLQHLGARRAPDTSDDWDGIAQAHERYYRQFQ